MLQKKKIAFIGVGNMAGAIIKGLMAQESPIGWSDLYLFDRYPDMCTPYVQQGAVASASIEEAVSAADCVVLAVKPQNFPEILPVLASTPNIQSKLFITIAAGITTNSIKTALGGSVSVVRALPNTPMLIGQGVIAVCQAPTVATEDFEFVCNLFRASGSVLVIDESEMNRIISVTSSSPAYVFAFIRALCDGATMQGLSMSSKELLDSVCDMVIGAATLLKTGTKTPAEQISTVTSKGGTTERAMGVLAEGDFEGLIHRAMQACTDRADELSRNA